jgi:hypothetical protein
MNITATKLLAGLGLAGLTIGSAHAAVGDSASYLFNLPSTAVASQSPPYPLVATLTLVEVVGGVQFTLTPNWLDPTTGFEAQSFIERLEYVYKGVEPDSIVDLTPLVAPIKTSDFSANANMDSGYKSDDQKIEINWATQNDPNRFESNESSSWQVNGAGIVLTSFTGTQATHESHPSPTFGIISVSAYSLEEPKPTPSNWVSGATPVPEPQTYALLLAGLAGLGFMARRRKTR